MSVWRRFPDHGYPSLVTTNVEHRHRIFARPEVARALVEVMTEVEQQEQILIHAYVIMPDHAHWVISLAPGKSLGRAVQLLKGRFAWRYNRSLNRVGKVWQTRFHEQALLNDSEFYNAIAYVHNNPLVAGLVREEHLYLWSSAANQREHGVRLTADPCDATLFFER